MRGGRASPLPLSPAKTLLRAMIGLNFRLHILPLTPRIPSSLLHFSLPSAPLFCCSAPRNRTRVLRHFTCRAMATEPAVSPSTVHVKDKIDLSEKERRIFDRLLATVSHFNLPTQLRVAGGWVRDKLLGKECYDIDIALDDMLGSKFAYKVTEYLASTGEKAQGVAVISSNPDQSKHLETARMRLYDVWIDFVNLRSEKYSEDSRIPSQMDFGTAEEDAYRRDLTINSLFYNINTSSVEDLTGRGIEDLKFGRIVTPLPPKETFLDDPLRVLRAIRFGARFKFTLDEELKKAAASDDVIEALATKISRERVGIEVDLMMSGNEPVKAVNYVNELNLFPVVFSFPPNYESRLPEDCNRLCVSYLDVAWNLVQSTGSSSFSDEQRRLALYAAVFLPFRKEKYKDNKAKKIPVVNHIIRNSLKRKTNDADIVIAVHNAAEGFSKLIPFLESNMDHHPSEVESSIEVLDVPASSRLRVSVGFLLREIKDFWRVALLISTLLRAPDIECSQDSANHGYDLERRTRTYAAVESAVITLGLDKIWEVKPLVNGKQIITVLQLKSGGPVVSEWQQRVLAWQLAYPCGTADECLDWMRETQSNSSKRAKLQ